MLTSSTSAPERSTVAGAITRFGIAVSTTTAPIARSLVRQSYTVEESPALATPRPLVAFP